MATKITTPNSGTLYYITASPTLITEVTGTDPSYVINSTRCILPAKTSCKTCLTKITVVDPCATAMVWASSVAAISVSAY